MDERFPHDLRRVVLVSNCAESVGGIRTFMSILAEWIVSQGVDVEFVSLNPPSRSFRRDPRFSYFDMRILRKWTRFAPPPSGAGWRRLAKSTTRRVLHPFVYPWVRRRFLRHFESFGPETTVIFTQVFAATALIDAGWKPLIHGGAGRPRIVGQWHSSYQGALRYPIVDEHRTSFAHADRFLLLTAKDAAEFRAVGCASTDVMPNPIDAWPLDLPRMRRAVAVCRFYPEKQLATMVRAFARATSGLAGWSLDLYGYGPCEAEIRAEIAAQAAGDRIHIMGVTTDPDEVFATSMLHLQTSLYEGFPYVILEAAAQGTPTLAYACSPGVEELVAPGTGYLVPAQDEEALERQIHAALADEADLERRGRAAAAHSRRYSSAEVLPRWAELFRELYPT